MPDWNTILQLATMGLIGAGAFLLKAAAKTMAEETAKETVKELNWQKELARELEKSRGVERQELRFKSYGALWKAMRPLAIYDPTPINKKTAGDLYTALTEWYFAESGGLLLTPQARYFYFALQDLLRMVARIPEEWSAERSEAMEGSSDATFLQVLQAREAKEAISVQKYFSAGAFEGWQDVASDLGKRWRKAIQDLGAGWMELNERERFATLQQVGSKLRSSLGNDLETRMR